VFYWKGDILKRMNLKSLTIGMTVNHPQYGTGTVKSLNEHIAEIRFDEGLKTVDPNRGDLSPAEPQVSITDLDMPLANLIEQVAQATVEKFETEQPEVRELGARWHGGKMVLHPADASLQPKDVPLETFFHKIVGVRNQLRVLEQKLNAHKGISDGEKVELQQYISRCYGSLTTFNVLFKDKEGQFSSK